MIHNDSILAYFSWRCTLGRMMYRYGKFTTNCMYLNWCYANSPDGCFRACIFSTLLYGFLYTQFLQKCENSFRVSASWNYNCPNNLMYVNLNRIFLKIFLHSFMRRVQKKTEENVWEFENILFKHFTFIWRSKGVGSGCNTITWFTFRSLIWIYLCNTFPQSTKLYVHENNITAKLTGKPIFSFSVFVVSFLKTLKFMSKT